MPLPDVRTLDEYRAIYHRDELWRPAIDEICDRHGLPEYPRLRGPDGTHIVYFAGREHIVKLFVPLFAHDFVAERLVATHLTGRLSVATPAIAAHGGIGGWNYLVMTRVPGRPLCEVWSQMPGVDRRAIAAKVGKIIAELRRVSTRGLEPLAVDWASFLATQIDTAAVRQEGSGFEWNLDEEIPRYIESTREIVSESFRPVLVLADITDEHVLVSDDDGSWSVVGYVDFGDAMIGHPDYELVAPGLDIARGDRDLLRTLLLTAGYHESDLNESLRRRLMVYTLIHRYVKLEDLTVTFSQARSARDLDELARMLWPMC